MRRSELHNTDVRAAVMSVPAGVSDRCGTLPVKDLPRERYVRILDKTLL
jgi:hypothetical protein